MLKKFLLAFRTAGAFRARGHVGPHRFAQKRPRTFVSVLQGLGATEASKNRPSRDFRGRSIFDFFNSIDPKRAPLLAEVSGPCDLAIGPERRQAEAMRSERLSNLIGATYQSSPLKALELSVDATRPSLTGANAYLNRAGVTR